jgi:hypothetical protein
MVSGITHSFSQKLELVKGFSVLPLEMLAIIARYLPDKDLYSMAHLDSACRCVALKERVARMLYALPRELTQFSDLQQHIFDRQRCPLWEFKRELIIQSPQQLYSQVLRELRQAVVAVATLDLAGRCSAYKRDLNRRIEQRNVSFADIDQSKLKQELLAEALISTIATAENPDATRKVAVMITARVGGTHTLQVLLENEVASGCNRGTAVLEALRHGHLGTVEALLANGSIPDAYRNAALAKAVIDGYLPIVETLLAHGPICEGYRSEAVFFASAAAVENPLIVKALLKNGSIFESYRKMAISEAESKGYDIIASLLRQGFEDPTL